MSGVDLSDERIAGLLERWADTVNDIEDYDGPHNLFNMRQEAKSVATALRARAVAQSCEGERNE